MFRSFFRRLWYLEREVWVENLDPVPVDWPMGPLRIRLTGRVTANVAVWMADGSVRGMAKEQAVELVLETNLDLPARGVMVLDVPATELQLQELSVRELPMVLGLKDEKPMPLAVFQGSGWMAVRDPRWRVLLRAVRGALRWAPVREERK